MTGYKPSKKDIEAIVVWLEKYDPDNANEDVAKQMLIDLKLSFRSIGRENPDALESFYKDFKRKKLD